VITSLLSPPGIIEADATAPTAENVWEKVKVNSVKKNLGRVHY
jgi:hypothetical protein